MFSFLHVEPDLDILFEKLNSLNMICISKTPSAHYAAGIEGLMQCFSSFIIRSVGTYS